jgi:hypothetical protein
MNRISAQELLRIKAQELGLNPDRHSLNSIEGIACSLRRAAGYLSPCSAATLVRAVVAPLEGLVPDLPQARESIEEVLEAVIANGDILEQRDFLGNLESAGTLLYAAPPSFVVRSSGSILILGIAPDYRTPLPGEFDERVEYAGHIRRLPGADAVSMRETLKNYGLIELTADYWIRMPAVVSADRHVAKANELLSKAPAFNADVPGLTILDPEEPVRYYRGRWKEPKKRSGRYVGRRKQAYGADLWCYVELVDGSAQRLIDFPFGTSRHRACDHAWHLQMGIDSIRGQPQEYAIETQDSEKSVLRFFSPVPQWAQRRLVAVGTPEVAKGCLFAYAMPNNEIGEERSFLSAGLWMSEKVAK